MKKKTKQSKRKMVTGRDPTSQLYRAVIRYVESHKGSILVIGGVQIEQWPEDRKGMFVLGVRCLGRKPEKKNA